WAELSRRMDRGRRSSLRDARDIRDRRRDGARTTRACGPHQSRDVSLSFDLRRTQVARVMTVLRHSLKGWLVLALALRAAPVAAQDSVRPAAAAPQAGAAVKGQEPGFDHPAGQAANKVDIILPHISDGDELDVPWLNAEGFRVVQLPHWAPIMIGGHALDLSPTKHVVMMLIAGLFACIILINAARAQARHTAKGEAPRGLSGTVEAMVLYIRHEVILPAVGPHGDAFVPYLLTVFFFILFANLLGLVPYGSTATGNISVTATLAIIAFFVIEISGMRALGKNYISTIIFWPHDMPFFGKLVMTLIM